MYHFKQLINSLKALTRMSQPGIDKAQLSRALNIIFNNDSIFKGQLISS